MPTSTSCLPLILRALALAALVALGACAQAPTQAPTTAGDSSSSTKGTEGGGKCYQGCITWGESCNVDPRGVYKCQRRCEKFGEICE
ncbi:MAG: hypothetical protein AB7I01_15355 [Gammaproteobacteria bacterium]